MYTPEQSARIQLLRQKITQGTITQEELKEGMALLRLQREGAHATADGARTKRASAAAKKNINSDALLGELDGL